MARRSDSGGLPAGTAAGIASAVLFGLAAPAAKKLLPGFGPLSLAGLLYLGAGVGLTLLSPLRRPAGLASEARLRRADLPSLALVTLSGGLLGPALLLFGLSRLSAVPASLLLNLEAPFTIGLAILFFGDHLGRREALGAGLVIAGAAGLSLGPGPLALDLAGAAAVTTACLAWALDNNFAQRLAARDPVAVVRVKALLAGAANLAIGLAAGDRFPAVGDLGPALAVGFLGYGVSVALHLQAVRHLGAARQAALFATAPFVGALAAVPFLGESVGLRAAGAGLVMAAGVLALVSARHGHAHTHDGLFHDHRHVHDAHHGHDHGGAPGTEPHAHPHAHEPVTHAHPHAPDLHHRHRH